MNVNIDDTQSPYFGLWLNDTNYVLNNELFENNNSVMNNMKSIGFKNIGDDVWCLSEPEDLSWKQLITLSLKILNSELTRLICLSMYLEEVPNNDIIDVKTIDLPKHEINNNKLIHCTCSWVNEGKKQSYELLSGFRLHDGRGNVAKGSWLHWIIFATKILSSENTEKSNRVYYCNELQIK